MSGVGIGVLSFGFRYRGTYCGQDVAIKILKAERLNDSLQQEFAQEVYIMRCPPLPLPSSHDGMMGRRHDGIV